MDYQTSLVKKFHLKAGQLAPDKPTVPSLEVRILRAKLILEEALETILDGLGVDVTLTCAAGCFTVRFNRLEFCESSSVEPNLVKIADGCADLKVVTVGTEIACGIDGEATFREVMRSNMSKYQWSDDDLKSIEGKGYRVIRGDHGIAVLNEYSKVIKPPSYSPANLEQFCKE